MQPTEAVKGKQQQTSLAISGAALSDSYLLILMTQELDRIADPMFQSLLVSGGGRFGSAKLGSGICEQNIGRCFMSLRDYAFFTSPIPRKFFLKKNHEVNSWIYRKNHFYLSMSNLHLIIWA